MLKVSRTVFLMVTGRLVDLDMPPQIAEDGAPCLILTRRMKSRTENYRKEARPFAGAGAALIQIVPAEPNDARVLTDIAFAAKRHWGYPEKWMEGWRDLLTIRPEFIVGHETHAAIVDGRTVGFYALGRKESRLDLLHMWVLPDCMGRGVGRSLFHHALERAQALGFRELEIESDPNAEGFYRHLGARRVGVSVKGWAGQRRELPILIFEINPVP
jgi:GNAT superfamily N-acetyltransferase